MVGRDHLVKRLLDTTHERVVVLSAPAGYGKTTTMLLWDEADDRGFAWVHLDPLDDDPVHLLRHVALALHELEPIDPGVARLLTGPGRPVDTGMLPALGRSLDGRDPFVLVLDDVHVLTSRAALRCVDGVLAHIPEGSQLALVGRSVRLPLARRRLHGVVELSSADLAMSEDEAALVLRHAGLRLGDAAVGTLVGQTEGWPGGLHLAALALTGRDEAARAAGFSGRDRLVADYLVEEVLEGLPEETVDFLSRSAVLQRMSAPLLDELLEIRSSGRLLREIERSGNLFLVPLDAEREWFRYHHLFGEMLRARLRSLDPTTADRLESRASAILERRGDVDGAVRHAVAAGETERAADLVLRHAVPLVFEGRVARLGGWLELLGADTIDRYPSAAISWAWFGLATGDQQLIHRATAAAERSRWDGPLADGSPSLPVAVATVRAMTAPEGLQGVVRDTEIVRRAGGPAANPWWGISTLLRGTAFSMLGELDRARGLLTAALPAVAGAPGFEAAVLAHLALLHLYDGDLAEADRLASRGLRLAERHDLEGVVPVVSVYAVGALVAARGGRPAEAARAAIVARRMLARLGDLSPRTVLLCNLLLAQAALALGQRAEARALADEAARARRREPSATHLNLQLDRVRQQVATGSGGGSAVAFALTSAELRILSYLPTHLSLQDIAEQLLISRNTAKTHAVAIYRKLGVSSRRDAVAEARRLGLLDGEPQSPR